MPPAMSDAEDSDDGHPVTGWDIGGVNTKVARVRRGAVLAARSRPFELQRAPDALSPLLANLASAVGAGASDHHAVTMTAELSQLFRLKRDGVDFVLDAVHSAFGPDRVSVFSVDGRFLSPDEARRVPLAVAAANWAATARLVAATNRDVILLDTGTTTTDIIPILGGREVALGRTDPERLVSGELVYTGVLRSPAEAIANHVPFRGALAGVSAEGFALAGDVHLWRGDLAPSDYTVPTPDGRPATREFAGERLARVVCADREMLDDAGVSMIADALAEAQVARVADAVWRVALRHPTLRTAVVTGLGAFIGAAAARRVGLDVVPLADILGEDAARSAPATAVALLYERSRGVASAT
jgi:probable H4MPT-linked C1 transfer pathway protein